MKKEKLKQGVWAAGGVALLAVASALCVKGMKVVDQRLKAKKAAEDAAFDEAGLFEDGDEGGVKFSVESDAAEEFAEEPAEDCTEEPVQQENE